MGQLISMQDIKVEVLKVWNYYGNAYVKVLFGTRNLYFKRSRDSGEGEITEVRYVGTYFEAVKTFSLRDLGVGTPLYESFKKVYNALIEEQEHIKRLDALHSKVRGNWGRLIGGEEWYMENHDFLH